MTSLRSLLDVLFILLLSTIVMLAHAAPIGAVETDLVRVGADGLSPIDAARTRVVLIRGDGFSLDGTDVASLEEIIDQLDPDDVALLVVADRSVAHHEVMDTWSTLRRNDQRVQLGAAPDANESEVTP